MIEDKFSTSELITVVMGFIQNIEKADIYGIKDDELELPVTLYNKINSMNDKVYKDFMEKISYIAEEVYTLKTGELNELNMIHAEVKRLSAQYLNDYLIS